jgi:uncharacterized protein YegP (UPF0339 family)
MVSHFEIFKGARGAFRFLLRAANGEIIASSEGYSQGVGGVGHGIGADQRARCHGRGQTG